MRLLFDEQLSEELIVLLRDTFPDSLHVRLLGAGGSSDHRVWQLAREHDCILVTKDEDFHRRSLGPRGTLAVTPEAAGSSHVDPANIFRFKYFHASSECRASGEQPEVECVNPRRDRNLEHFRSTGRRAPEIH